MGNMTDMAGDIALNVYRDKIIPMFPKILLAIVIAVVGYIAIKVITTLVKRFFDKVDFDRAMETFMENFITVALWILLGVIILSNLGVDVTGLVAGLGIMGFVVGFALKDTLGNLASGVFILFHKPFRVGDWVEVGGISGSVQAIAVAACTVHTFGNEKVTIPNSVIWGSPITNYTGNKWRRMEIMVGISYDDDINKAFTAIDKVIKSEERILPEPAPQIIVKNMGASSIDISVRCCANTDVFMDTRWAMTKALKEGVEKEGITIAFPQMDIHFKPEMMQKMVK